MKKNKKADFNVINTFCNLSEALESLGDKEFNKTVEMLENGPYTSEIAENLLQLSKYLHINPLEAMLLWRPIPNNLSAKTLSISMTSPDSST